MYKRQDFGFVLNLLGTEGYLTSARAGGSGQDDIYSFRMPLNATAKKKVPQTTKVKICAYEEGTDDRLSDVQFKVIEKKRDLSTASMNADLAMLLEQTEKKNEYLLKFRKDENEEEMVTTLHNTDEKGEFEATLKKDKMYVLIATKNGYAIAEETLDGEKFIGIDDYQFCMPLKSKDCMSMNGIVKNKKYGNLIPGATVTMMNLCTGDEVVVTADTEGAFSFPCIPCDCDFVLKGEKNNLSPGFSKENTKNENCIIDKDLYTELLLAPDDEKLEAMFEGTKLEVGAKIELKNIYYDFDQYYIVTMPKMILRILSA